MADLGWDSYNERQEAQAIESCNNAAVKAGHLISEAGQCDDGTLACPQCPWAIVTNKNLKRVAMEAHKAHRSGHLNWIEHGRIIIDIHRIEQGYPPVLRPSFEVGA